MSDLVRRLRGGDFTLNYCLRLCEESADEIERLQAAWDSSFRQAMENGAKFQAAQAEVQALKADARRYRLWRAEYTRDSSATEPLLVALSDAWTPAAVDAVLDAAMQAAKERVL